MNRVVSDRWSVPRGCWANILAALFVACCFFLLPGCRSPLQPPDAPESDMPGEGTLLLTIGHGLQRTILPNPTLNEFARFDLRFVNTGGGFPDVVIPRTYGELAQDITLSVGTWNLIVTAFMLATGYDVGYLEAATGTYEDIHVGEGTNAPVHVILRPIAGGTGTFNWDIRLSADNVAVTGATMEIRYACDDNIHHTVDNLKTEWTGTRSLPAGEYRVVVTVMANDGGRERMTRVRAILHVYRNLTSTWDDIEFTGNCFAAPLLYDILDAWNGSEWDFYSAGIRAGHFYLSGIAGVAYETATGFNDIVDFSNLTA